LTPEFWNDITPERRTEIEDNDAADFNAYLKELSKRYSELFMDPLPEHPDFQRHNPYAGYTRPENFKDENLQ